MPKYNFKYVKEGPAKDQFIEYANTPALELKELYVKKIENGYLLPKRIRKDKINWMGIGGVLDSNKEWVEESGVYRNENEKVFGGVYKVTENLIERHMEETVIYMGPFFPHWGHFLLDFIPRLWYAMKEDKISRIVYLNEDNSEKISGNYAELIELMGLDINRFVDVRFLTSCNKIVIPQPCFQRGKYYSEMYRYMLDTIVSNVGDLELPKYEKLYLSRAHFGENTGKESGYEEIDKIFEENGYAVMYPEELSAREQIYYINHCKEFVVVPGGSSMNMLFLKDNANIVFLQKESIVPNINDLFFMSQLKKVNSVDYVSIYVLANFIQQIVEKKRDRFWVGITPEFENYIRSREFKISQNLESDKCVEKVMHEQICYFESQNEKQTSIKNNCDIDRIIEKEENRKLILFGSGYCAKNFLGKYGYDKVAYFCDNDSTKVGGGIGGIEIISYSKMLEFYDESYLVVITVVKFDNIAKQLESSSIKDYLIYQLS